MREMGRARYWANREQELAATRARRRADPEKARAQSRAAHAKETPEQRRRWRLNQRFGIDESQYQDMLANQNGRCGICGSSDAGGRFGVMVVDHCHQTGAVRGLLCSRCNRGLGQLGDSIESIEAAIAYIRSRG